MNNINKKKEIVKYSKLFSSIESQTLIFSNSLLEKLPKALKITIKLLDNFFL